MVHGIEGKGDPESRGCVPEVFKGAGAMTRGVGIAEGCGMDNSKLAEIKLSN